MSNAEAATRFQKICVIVNPVAGHEDPPLRRLVHIGEELGLNADIRVTSRENNGRSIAQALIGSDVDVVAVYGGDGTIKEVAEALCDTDIPIAILPGGTANVVAHELGIPLDIEQAMRLACGATCQVRAVDMGSVEGQLFLLRAGVGWEAEISLRAKRGIKERLGTLAYIQSALASLAESEPTRYMLTLDDDTVEIEGINCSICNSANIGLPGVELASDTYVDDGLLDVVIIQHSNLGGFLEYLGGIVATRLESSLLETLPQWKARKITVEAQGVQPVTLDGELLDCAFPFQAEVRPGAIQVIVPQVQEKGAN